VIILGQDPKVDDKKDNFKVVPFKRDVDYYYQKGNSYYYKNNWEKALLYFKKAIEVEPDEPLNYYNLGCLLSKMGELDEANQTFEYILENLDDTYWECYFLLAINYGLMEEFERAQSYLQQYLQSSPEGEMVFEAQELLWALTEEDLEMEEDEVDEELFREYRQEILLDIDNLSRDEFVGKYEGNDFLIQVLQRILYQDDDARKEEIIKLLGHMRNKVAAKLLKDFVRNPWAKDRHKQMALLEMKNMGFYHRCQVYLKGRFLEVDLHNFPVKAPVWKDEWEEVLNCALENMQLNNYHEVLLESAQAIWLDFINAKSPHMPAIKKFETWAAGLEYSLARFYLLDITQKEIAKKYGVSCASVSNKYQTFNEILKLE